MTQSKESAPNRSPARSFVDLGAGLTLLLVAGVSLSQMGTGIRNWLFPRALTYLLGVIGIVLIVRWVVLAAPRPDQAGSVTRMRGTRRLAIAVDIGVVAAAVLLYAVAMPVIGFWFTTFFVVLSLSIFLTERKNAKTVGISVTVAALVCIVGYLVFLHVFYVPVPTGFLL